MNKTAIKEELIRMQNKIIHELEEKVRTTHSMVDIDETNTLDPEDFSHQYESAEMEQLMKVQLNRAKRNLDILNSLDFSEKNAIEPGAYVETNKFNFLIGFTTVPFDVNGKHIVGISIDSPIYSIMLGRKSGETFEFCGAHYVIEQIN